MRIAIRYGTTPENTVERELTADDLQLISSALEIVNPDSDSAEKRARELALDFEILAELAEEF